MLWGWMPCGLSTTLLAAAWLQADALPRRADHGRVRPRHAAADGVADLVGRAHLGAPATRGLAHRGRGSLVLLAGVVTVAAPWLMQMPALHGVLSALGCRTLPT